MARKRITLQSFTERYLVERIGSKITLSDVANEAIERWMTCEREAKINLAGVFSKNELAAFLGMGDDIIELSSPIDFIHEFENACDAYDFEKEYDIDKETVIEKLQDLSSVELLVLWDWELLYSRLLDKGEDIGRNEYISRIN